MSGISENVQTLSAAFAFGILLQAAAGALFIYYRGHGSTIFQDGRRLVLILFLLFAALWAQTQFLNLLLADTMETACQATLIISTMFDQLARIGIEQFLLWSVGHGTKLTAERLILQGVLLVRMVAGGVLVGFTRPHFAPVCSAHTSIAALAIVVLALDAIIIGVLMVRAVSLGMFKEMREKSSSTRQEQSKALILSIIALGLWTGSSVPMILGLPSFNLMVRTVVPANGLLVMVAVVVMFPGALLLAREENGTTPEASSPFVTPMPPREIFADNVRSNGSPISTNNRYTRDGSLFVVNPSNTPHDSPTIFQRSPRGDTRGFTKLGNEINVREISDTPPERPERPGLIGNRRSSGVFPSMLNNSQAGLQGALAPQIRPKSPLASDPAAAFQFPAVQQKRSMFGWSKQAPVKPSIRSLAISNPVALDVSGGISQPFPKMETIDLATAAAMERERREGAQARAKLVANRLAPQPPQFSTSEAFLKRKEMPALPVEPTPIVSATFVAGLSQVATSGVTSSASLSPGREEVRRRSPKQTNSFDQTFTEKPLQPTLQRKKTVGLPSNPRATRIAVPQEAAMVRPQTVMLMNDVVYDNPDVVQNIIKDAPAMYAAAQKTRDMEEPVRPELVTMESSESVLHRPRPYKREQNEDRAIFPSIASPNHRRSRSGSSIMPRKSCIMAEPGSPTRLPCLPPLPPTAITSAANLKRLLPNNTKSMTFNEKIEMLFPAPPEPTTNRSRRSSVPSLPRAPSVFMFDTPMVQSPTLEEEESRRISKRTTIASFAVPDIPAKSSKRQSTRAEEIGYRFSANTYRTIADGVGETWIPGIQTEEINPPKSVGNNSRRLSIVDDSRKSHWTEASEETSQDDSTTYWGSVHSKVPTVDLADLKKQTSSLYIEPPVAPESRDSTQFEPFDPLPDDLGRCEAFVPLMLDAEAYRLSFTNAKKSRGSVSLSPNQSVHGDRTSSPVKNHNGWHHRIGDELPTFSERTYPKGRKMPPPTPLLLSRTGKRASVVVRPSEPSPPADYPEKAIAEIQAQLQNFEDEPGRDSVGSMLRHMPEVQSAAVPHTGRFTLLANLEEEMGQQESHWQQLHINLDRDSVSEAMSPFTRAQSEEDSEGSQGTLSRQSSQRSLRTPAKITRTLTRIRSSMTTSDRTGSTSSSDNSRASIWQRRLAEAQMEYIDNAPTLLRKKSLNFLSITKYKSPMMSPTPPESVESESDIETELESDSDTEAMMKYQAPLSKKLKAVLWQPSLPSPKAAFGRMWNPPYETSSTSSDVAPPARGLRPAQRRMENSLSIFSAQLWVKPRSAEHSRPVVGLWGSKLVRPRSITTRPVTQRPQRKSKRMTFLPDIVESPVPLPDKRETLGLYKFPWGETSDQPTYQPAFNPLTMGAPIQSSKLDARSRQLEPEQSEHSSSFFDDYEEDDESMDVESDDDFDENTLWEIANLLQSRDVPSRDSLLLEPSAIIDDYDLSFDPESPDAAALSPVGRASVQPLAVTSRLVPQLWAGDSSPPLGNSAPGLPQPESHVWDALIPAKTDIVRSKSVSSSIIPTISSRDMWVAPEVESSIALDSFMWSSDIAADISSASNSASPSGASSSALMWSAKADTTETRRSGMFTIPSEIIRSTDAIPAAIKMIKAVRPSVGEIPAISSRNLWTRQENNKEAASWISKSSMPQAEQIQKVSTLLWAPVPVTSEILILGLFDVAVPRSSFRTSEAMPAAINMICKPRMSLAPMSTLTSSKLWSACQDKCPVERDWITESSTRPDSPTYSTISSGTSSPTSDSSSVKSTSTKGSSIWSSPFAAIPTWWDRKGKKSPVTPPQDESSNSPKLLDRQAPTPLVAVRESRVLASRDLWESRAPVLEKTPAKKLRSGTVVQESAVPVKSMPSQRQRLVASRSDWDNALAQAIAAGSTTKVLMRSTYKTSDWESALSEAISQSKPRLQRPAYSPAAWSAALEEALNASVVKPSYDASILHPVFFAESLVSSVSDVHPAAVGRVSYDASVLHPVFHTTSLVSNISDVHPAAIGRVSYDASILHPVFFAESLVSSVSDIHPAAIGRVSYDASVLHPVYHTASLVSDVSDIHPAAIGRFTYKAAQPTMWTSASAPAVPKASMMWSKDNVTPRATTVSLILSSEIPRKAPVARAISAPVLESTAFWTPTRVEPQAKNWLLSTAKTSKTSFPSAQTWTPIIASLEPQNNTTMAAMWTSSAQSTPDIFASAKSSYVKQVSSSRPAGLTRLASNEMFASSAQAAQEPTHWLHATSAPAVPTLSKALTWSPSTISTPAPQQMGMWQPAVAIATSPEQLFTNAHSEPWSRTKRTAEAVPVFETEEDQSMWHRSTDLPSSPKNWLVGSERRFSRVFFRR